MTDEWVIDTQQLHKRFGALDAVHALNLRVPADGITGFLGRNGAGKSSTIKMLLGMMRPTSGTGTVLGRRVDDPRESRDMRRRIAYVGEDKQMYAYMTVEQVIAFTRSFYADWQPDAERRLLAEYELPPRRRVRALSKGMRTKLALLLAMARRPALLILDEPSEGLDPVAIEALLQALVSAAADGTAVFFSSHQITEVERIADRVCILDRGRLMLEIDLDQMRQDYRHVTIGFAIPVPPVSFDIDGVEHVAVTGRQTTVLVSRNVDAVVAYAHGLPVVSVDVTSVGLREVFLDVVKGAGQRSAGTRA